jgi:hypothetical protein
MNPTTVSGLDSNPTPFTPTEEQENKLLLDLQRQYVVAKINPEKFHQYAQARMAYYYFNGYQWLVPEVTEGNVVDYKPINGSLQKVDNTNGGTFMSTWIINAFAGDVKKFVAILGNKAPNCVARPDWPDNADHMERAGIASEVSAYQNSQWDVNGLNQYLAFSLGIYGTTFIYTPWYVDKDIYGDRKEEKFRLEKKKLTPDQWVCYNCGTIMDQDINSPQDGVNCISCGSFLGPESYHPAPEEDVAVSEGFETYPNGSTGCIIATLQEVITPFYIKDLKDTPWLKFSLELEPTKVVQRHPGKGLEKFLKGGMPQSEDQYGARTREISSSILPTLSGSRGNWTYSETWIKPSMYNWAYALVDEKEDPKNWVDYLTRKYPKGLRITIVGNEQIVNKANSDLTEEWVAIKPGPSDYLYAKAHFSDYMQIQDMMNNAWNLDYMKRMLSTPINMFDESMISSNVFRNKQFYPGEYVPVKPETQGRLSDAIFQTKSSEPDPTGHSYISTLQDAAREIVGLFPAVFGGEDISGQTAEEARRKLNQALMVLSIVWTYMRKGWEGARYNAALQLARYSDGNFYYARNGLDVSLTKPQPRLKLLLQGGWHYECDQAIPLSWTQLRDWVMSLFTQAPAFAQAMGATDPANLAKIAEGMAVPGWKIPNLETRKRILKTIQLLLQGQAIPDPLTGQSTPSIPFDAFKYPPDVTVTVIKDWLDSEEASQSEGTPGMENVVAFGMSAMQAMAPT